MRLEQADQLLAGRHRLTIKDAPLALSEDTLDQRQIVAESGAPALDRNPGEVGHCAVLVERPGVLTCARTPSANRRRPLHGTLVRHDGAVR
jgi:hypothetical protein